MLLFKNAPNVRGISWDYEEGDGPQQINIPGDFVCDCIHANNPSTFQDHADSTWDYFTYLQGLSLNGISLPSVAPIAQNNENYSVGISGFNSNCWVNSLFSGTKPTFYQSTNTRSFGASYFTETFTPYGIMCQGEYNQTCISNLNALNNEEKLKIEYFSICDGGLDKIKKKIGMYGPGSSTVTMISPTHVSICGHCIGGDNNYEFGMQFYNPNTQSFQSVTIDVYDTNYNQYTTALYDYKDMRLGKIKEAGITFPHHYQYYLNPFSLRDHIINKNIDPNEDLAMFTVNANGVFFITYLSYEKIKTISQLNLILPLRPIISGIKYPIVKNIQQPKYFIAVTGHSGTNIMFFSKTGINIWPAGAYAGQSYSTSWELLDGKYGIDFVNDFLAGEGEPTLTEFTDFDNLYKMSDFVEQADEEDDSMKVTIKKFNKTLTYQDTKFNSSKGIISKIKIKKTSNTEKYYK